MRPIVRKVFATEYALARAPLAVLDSAVGRRLPERSKVRRTVRGGIGRLDALAERLLNDDASAGAAPDAPRTADDLPAEVEVIAAEQAEIVETLLSDEVQRRQVGELAEEPEDVRQELAELRAKHLAEERAEQRALKEQPEPARAAPTKATAQSPAKSASAKSTPAKSTPAKKAPAKKVTKSQ